MNILLQVGIGLLPGTIVTLFLLAKRKAIRFTRILAALVLIGINGLFLYSGIVSGNDGDEYAESVDKEKMMAFSNSLYCEKAYNLAKEVLEDYSERFGYDDECRLMFARIYLAAGDYVRANGLYKYLVSNTDLVDSNDEEVEYAADRAVYSESDLATISYLADNGENVEDYGYTDSSYDEISAVFQKDEDSVISAVGSSIKKQYDFDDGYLADCAKAVYGIDTYYSGYQYDEESGGQDSSYAAYKKTFKEIAGEEPELLDISCVKKAYLKLNALDGNFDNMVADLDDNSSYHELMVAAELYMSGLVKDSDFPEEYRTIDKTKASAVKKQLSKIYEDNKDESSVQENKRLKERVDAVGELMENPVMGALKEKLTDAADDEAGTDRTKVYLELAKIESYFGNETSTNSDLSVAIFDSQICEDDEYVDAMAKIISVINNDGTENTDEIKNVSEYVGTVLDNSLTIDVEGIIAAGSSVDGEASEDEQDETADESFREKFGQTAVDYVSKAKSAITIGKIDTTDFEKVKAKVQISSDYITDLESLKKVLKIYDCGAEITDYTLEKIDYSSSNILLCCDVSGSMSGNIGDLKDAVITFVEDKNSDEDISVVTFDDSIVDTKPFGTSDEELKNFAQDMRALGGTDMFSAVLSCLNNFSYSGTENNILILMTDGQDNNPKSAEDIYAQIGSLAEKKGVTIYTLGLGSEVDTAYLTTIAASGNGDFVYVSDSSSLTSFYDMLHEQLYDQYELTYNAIDTITMDNRTLEVSLPSENLKDIKMYSLGDEKEDENVLENVSVFGMSPCLVKNGSSAVDVKLKGEGFGKDDSVTVKLNGNIDYTLSTEYVDSQTIRVSVPSTIAVDIYNVEVTINGKRKVIQDGFEVAGDGETTVKFGPYVFTAAKRTDNSDGSITLKGNVMLNGWLHFRGSLTIEGDYENDQSIRVTDSSGSYVPYDTATATGLANVIAASGTNLYIPALHTFKLYNDQAHLYDYGNYQVDDIATGALELFQMMSFDSPVIRLYPNSIGIYMETGTTMLPYQNQILKACGDSASIFKFSFDGSGQITDKQIGVVLDISAGDADDEEFNRKANLFGSSIYYNGSISAKINTLKNEYSLGAMVRMAFFAQQSGIGLDVSWKGGLLNVDSVKLSLSPARDLKFPGTIPLTANDFSFMVSDIQTAVENHDWKNIKFTGSATISSGKVKEYIPQLEKFIGDVTLLEMPGTTAAFRVSPFLVEADAKLNLFKEITIAQASVKLGTFDYSNTLLDLDSESVSGFSGSLKTGIEWNSANGRIKLEMSGTTEVDVHSRFGGVCNTGTCEYDINWWLINTEKSINGQSVFGLYTTHSDKRELVFAMKYTADNGKIKGFFYYIDENGKCGKDNGFLS